MLRGDERNNGVLLRQRCFERVGPRAVRGAGLLLPPHGAPVLQRRAEGFEGLPLPEVEEGWLDLVLVTEIRHRHPIDEMATQNGRLILGRELAPLALLAVRFV